MLEEQRLTAFTTDVLRKFIEPKMRERRKRKYKALSLLLVTRS